MSKIVKLTLAAIVLASLWGAAPMPPAAARPAADGPNLLVNPGFESPYAKQCCHTDLSVYFPNTLIDEVQVANGWRGWWLEPRFPDYPPTCDNCMAWHRPEWREAAPFSNRIHSGSNAQKYFTFFSTHKAGMYQQVSGITSGQRLRFSVYMHAWSVNGNSLISTTKDNDMQMKVGIDPFGGTDPFSSRIVWSTPFNTYDTWALYTVEAVAQSSTVTVFTHSQPRWGMEHNDIYVDDASLVVVSGSSATATPVPTSTTAPTTSAATATPVPTSTTAPTTSAATATPIPTSSLLPSIARRRQGSTTSAATATPIPTSVPPTSTPAPSFTTYTVQRGDTLYGIARKFGVSVNTLLAVNAISNSSRIFVGQAIKIPASGSAPAPTATKTATGGSAPTATTAANLGQGTTYTIVRGDRLTNIARKFNTSVNAILAVNPGLDPSRIFAGQVINIPSTQATRAYVVQAGDTLRKIADKFGVTVAAIQALNNISNANTIFVGQTLLIP